MESLRGKLLVAGATLLDPNFRRTVVLVGQHDEEGAVGVVLNRPSGVSVHDAVPPLSTLVAPGDLLFVGGPVQPQSAVVVADFDDPGQAGLLAFGTIGFLLGDVDAEEVHGVRRARVYAGYAGWGPGQLEAEVEEQAWIVEAALPEDVFAAEPERLWTIVLRRKGREYLLLSTMPPDPTLN